jgi:hypothetical protein
MKFHLYPADFPEILRFDGPFCPFTIAFQEIATSCHLDNVPERVCLGKDFVIIPPDVFLFSVAKCTFNDLHVNAIQTNIFPQEGCGKRFNRDNVLGAARCTDTEGSDICTNIDDPVCRAQVIEPVFRYVKDLAEPALLNKKFDGITSDKNRGFV